MTQATSKANLNEIRGNAHPNCVVCDLANPKGLGIEYILSEKDDMEIKAVFICDQRYEGYPGLMHGGVISAVLDGAMGNCMFAQGLTAVTIEMTTRYRRPVITGKKADVSARIMRSSNPLYLLEAELAQDGEIKATAKGKYYHQPELADSFKDIE